MKLNKDTKHLLRPGMILKSGNYLYGIRSVIKATDRCGSARSVSLTIFCGDGRTIYADPASKWYGCEIIEPEVFYTGGGIWLSALYTDKNFYYVVDNDCDKLYDPCDCITLYDHSTDEDDDTDYPCQNCVGSWEVANMNRDQRFYYTALKLALLDQMN